MRRLALINNIIPDQQTIMHFPWFSRISFLTAQLFISSQTSRNIIIFLTYPSITHLILFHRTHGYISIPNKIFPGWKYAINLSSTPRKVDLLQLLQSIQRPTFLQKEYVITC